MLITQCSGTNDPIKDLNEQIIKVKMQMSPLQVRIDLNSSQFAKNSSNAAKEMMSSTQEEL